MPESYITLAAAQAATAGDWTVDSLLHTQLIPVPSLYTMAPESRLALAVLEDAVMTLRAAAGVQTPRARRLAAEARMWIDSDDTEHPFAFMNVCEYLGLSAGWLRAGVRRACRPRPDQVRSRVRRLRPNAYRDRMLTLSWRSTARQE